MSAAHQGLRSTGTFRDRSSQACVFRDLLSCSSSGKIAYCVLVGDVDLWLSHLEPVVSFASSSLSEWMLALNTWENMGEAKEDSLKHRIYPDNRIEAIEIDAPNPENVG